jgi:hypothetical protein
MEDWGGEGGGSRLPREIMKLIRSLYTGYTSPLRAAPLLAAAAAPPPSASHRPGRWLPSEAAAVVLWRQLSDALAEGGGAACPRGEVAMVVIGGDPAADGDGGDAADRIFGSIRYAGALLGLGSAALICGDIGGPLSGNAERSGKKRSKEER